jgi:phosphoribosylformylglycinamidine cyclo-ligase
MADHKSGAKLNYAQAGVDIKAGDEAVARIKELARSTFNSSVLSEIGSFGGFYKPDFGAMSNPVLVSSCDGVGTKLKLAFMTGKHDTVGEDLVNHCINDILVHAARPLFFLDYIATGKLKPEVIGEVVSGLARGCRNAGIALLGGETAEMPDFYTAGEYDLAGFVIGVVDQDKIVNGAAIAEGDVCIGLASNGLHTNGYSLARRVAFEAAGLKADSWVEELQCGIAPALMRVHRCYASIVFKLLDKYHIHGMAHITGGGIPGNLNRIIPDGLSAVVTRNTWPVLPIFHWLGQAGNIDPDDMYSAFNMGIGYILVVPASEADRMIDTLGIMGETGYRIGTIERGTQKVKMIGS